MNGSEKKWKQIGGLPEEEEEEEEEDVSKSACISECEKWEWERGWGMVVLKNGRPTRVPEEEVQ
ncbi:hypothetical protein TIFTF001_026185 [Ficus carica]|uniref:Uncharacterized protein n=1 Tax=Ficus carica TaxID=3494 RepID=A0AA88DKS1_FICCA|nr:hypothetical protein TIFTF001_026185 [Ficus carica]